MKNPNNVSTDKLHRAIRQALWVCELRYWINGMEFELYHTFDGKHMAGSLHFKNRAFDGGLPSMDREKVLREIRMTLGPEYDVVEEGSCVHVEWDPK